MNYKLQLEIFSKALSPLEPSAHGNFHDLVDFPEKLSIYRRNLLQGFFEQLSNDFKATATYLEKNNFQFFARKFLIDCGLPSENIVDALIEFPTYLDSQFKIHEDDLLPLIAQIDLLWSHPGRTSKQLEVPKNLLKYWLSLTNFQESIGEIEINFQIKESIKVIEINGEQALTIQQLL